MATILYGLGFIIVLMIVLRFLGLI